MEVSLTLSHNSFSVSWEAVKPVYFPESAIAYMWKKLFHMLLYRMRHNCMCVKMFLDFSLQETFF